MPTLTASVRTSIVAALVTAIALAILPPSMAHAAAADLPSDDYASHTVPVEASGEKPVADVGITDVTPARARAAAAKVAVRTLEVRNSGSGGSGALTIQVAAPARGDRITAITLGGVACSVTIRTCVREDLAAGAALRLVVRIAVAPARANGKPARVVWRAISASAELAESADTIVLTEAVASRYRVPVA